MLKKIKIQGYKSLVAVEIALQPLSVLFGPNAAGKSNFLDALQLLSSMVTSRTLKEAFTPPYRGSPLESFTFPEEGIKGLLTKEKAVISIEADVALSALVIDKVNQQIQHMRGTKTSEETGPKPPYVREKNLRYRIEIEILPRSGCLRVADEYLAPINAQGDGSKKRKPFLEQVNNCLQLRMEGQAHPTYYDRYLDHSILSLPLYPPHYPHLVAMRQELASWRLFYFEPREQMRAKNLVTEVHHLGLMGENLATFLNTLRSLDERQFKGIEKSLQLLIPAITGIEVTPNELGEVELQLREGNIAMPSRVLSEGMLRILGLLALGSMKEDTTLIGFEEPENGIHPRRLRLVAELLKSRASLAESQLIVTTHSPLLLNEMPSEFLYTCRRVQGHTVIDSYPQWESFGKLNRHSKIDRLLHFEEDRLPISERILRGDFDA